MEKALRIINSILFRRGPIYVHFGITHRCNLRCRMCNIRRDHPKDELSLDEIGRSFGILKKLGVIYASIGGGEPFLRKDLPEVVRMLIAKDMRVRVLTNGTIIDGEFTARLISAGLKEVSVSLDSLDNETQSYITGDKDALKRSVETIKLFSRALKGKRRLLLINTVVSPLNIDELPMLHEFAKANGYFISFVPIEAASSSEFSFRGKALGKLERIYGYLERLKSSGKSRIFNSSLFLRKSAEYMRTGRRNWKCDAGRLYYSLDPAGHLSACHNYPAILSLPEMEAENTDILKAAMERCKSLTDSCKGCMRPCWAELSFVSGDRRSLAEMARIQLLSGKE